MRLDPGVSVDAHILSREEVFVVLGGSAIATIDGERATIAVSDALVVPPGLPFSLSVSGDNAFEAIAMMAVGGQATMVAGGGAAFAPPWPV